MKVSKTQIINSAHAISDAGIAEVVARAKKNNHLVKALEEGATELLEPFNGIGSAIRAAQRYANLRKKFPHLPKLGGN